MADPVSILSVFSGTGMLDAGVECALAERGVDCRVVGYVEREAAAAYTLLARMENQTLRPAPVWADRLEDLDAWPLRGWVDILTASPPCQPYSSAGKRAGNEDERSHGDGDGPLVHLARIISECGPTVVFFENVPEWVTGGHFRAFGERLCGMGYDLAPPVFLASGDLGAPHRRERVFVLGWMDDAERGGGFLRASLPDARSAKGGARKDRCTSRSGARVRAAVDHADRAGSGRGGEEQQAGARVGRCGSPDDGGGLGNTDGSERREHEPGRGSEGRGAAWGTGADVADAGGTRPEGARHPGKARNRGTAAIGDELGLVPPGRNDWRAWAAVAALDPSLMPAVEPRLPVVADALAPSSSDLLRLGGNGVDPLVAAVAFGVLLDSIDA